MDFWKTTSGIALLAAFGAAGFLGYDKIEDQLDGARPADVVQVMDSSRTSDNDSAKPDPVTVALPPSVCILQARTCSAAPGEVRPDWPLPAGCTCRPWECRLPGGIASAAQALTDDLGDGIRLWRVLWNTDGCRLVAGLTEEDFAKVIPADALTVQVEGPSCGLDPQGKPLRCELKATKTTASDKVSGKASLRGGFSGHVAKSIEVDPTSLGIAAQVIPEKVVTK